MCHLFSLRRLIKDMVGTSVTLSNTGLRHQVDTLTLSLCQLHVSFLRLHEAIDANEEQWHITSHLFSSSGQLSNHIPVVSTHNHHSDDEMRLSVNLSIQVIQDWHDWHQEVQQSRKLILKETRDAVWMTWSFKWTYCVLVGEWEQIVALVPELNIMLLTQNMQP